MFLWIGFKYCCSSSSGSKELLEFDPEGSVNADGERVHNDDYESGSDVENQYKEVG